MNIPPIDDECPFCSIARTYPPTPGYVPNNPNSTMLMPNCHLILSTPSVMAFLDILPLSEGHTLVVPRNHRVKLKDLKGAEGAALGTWLPVVSRAVMKALGRAEGDWNIVQNNGRLARQVVDHVHYHIIPHRGLEPEPVKPSWKSFGIGSREELDDDEGAKLAADVRTHLKADLQAMDQDDPEGRQLLGKL